MVTRMLCKRRCVGAHSHHHPPYALTPCKHAHTCALAHACLHQCVRTHTWTNFTLACSYAGKLTARQSPPRPFKAHSMPVQSTPLVRSKYTTQHARALLARRRGPGALARSRWYSASGDWEWRPCTVISAAPDGSTYAIRWATEDQATRGEGVARTRARELVLLCVRVSLCCFVCVSLCCCVCVSLCCCVAVLLCVCLLCTRHAGGLFVLSAQLLAGHAAYAAHLCCVRARHWHTAAALACAPMWPRVCPGCRTLLDCRLLRVCTLPTMCVCVLVCTCLFVCA